MKLKQDGYYLGRVMIIIKTSNNFEFPLLKRDKNSAQRQGFTSADTLYLINPDRFANGDKQNDTVPSMLEAANPSIKGGRHGGDIQGVINALPYLNDLGVTQLWLTPVLENNMPNYSYHGYAITDFYKVDPRMGSNQLYKTLSVKAKEQGIGLVMDMVLNHFGSGMSSLALALRGADNLPDNGAGSPQSIECAGRRRRQPWCQRRQQEPGRQR